MKKKLLTFVQIFLAKCAKFYLFRTRPKVIGITGSVGKTSCRMIVSGVLKKYLPNKLIYTSEKNFNSELGLVFSVFQIKDYSPGIGSLLKLTIKIFFAALFRGKRYDILLLEYGIDHPGDMDFLLGICKPDYAVFTKLDKIHSLYFDTPNGIGDEKIKLLKNAKIKSYLNPLDDFCIKIINEIEGEKEYFTEIKNYRLEKKNNILGSSFKCNNKAFSTNLVGKENIDYIGLGLQILKELGGEEKYKYHLDLDIQYGRFTILEGIKENILIDSSYNAGPESMKKMIENTFFIRDQLFNDYKIILVLGELRELGEDIIKQEHEKLYSQTENADAIFMVGEEMKYLEQELLINNYKGFLKRFIKSTQAGKELKNYLQNSDEKFIILFKGGQNTIFTEEALKQVLNNSDDENKLVRQSKEWMKVKNKFFSK